MKLMNVSFKTTTYNFPEQDHPGRGKADDIFIDSKGIVYLNKSSYTTCSLNSPDWELSSSKTELIRESDRGHAYNLVLKYKSINRIHQIHNNITILYHSFHICQHV